MSVNRVREAFIRKKKKIVTNVTIGGGGPANKMLQFLKLCLKSISGHSGSFWLKKMLGENGGGVPILSQFPANFGF